MKVHSINLAPYLRYARTWLLVAVLPAVVAGALGYEHARAQTKTYDASTTLYVQQPTLGSFGATGAPDIYTSEALAQTYDQLATQPIVSQAADTALARRYPGYRVENHNPRASSDSQQQTPLITLTVTDTGPIRAADAANALAQAFIAEIRQFNQSRFAVDATSLDLQLKRERANIDGVTRQIAVYRGPVSGLADLRATLASYQSDYHALLSSTEQLKLTRDQTSSNVGVYSPAAPPTAPNSSHPLQSAVEWAFLILLLGSGGIYAYEYISDLPRSPEEVEASAGAPVLGSIPSVDDRQSGQLITSRPNSAASEAYRLLRTNLQFAGGGKPLRVVVVTSSLPQEGKTTTVSNLACVLAQGGKHVALVDSDLRRPRLRRVFQQPAQPGLSNLLVGGQLNGRAAVPTDLTNLSLLSSGPVPPNPADLLNSDRMRDVLAHLQKSADIVLLDSPPVLPVADASILASMADGVILVVDPNKTRRRDIRQARESIDAVEGRLLGVVMNRLQSGGFGGYYYDGYQSYDYRPSGDGEGAGSQPVEAEDTSG